MTKKINPSLRTPRSFRTLDEFVLQKDIFDFLVMAHDRVKGFYSKIFKFQKNIKIREKCTLGTFLGFASFSSYFQIKETAWKRSDAIFSESKGSLGRFRNIIFKMEKLSKSLIAL